MCTKRGWSAASRSPHLLVSAPAHRPSPCPKSPRRWHPLTHDPPRQDDRPGLGCSATTFPMRQTGPVRPARPARPTRWQARRAGRRLSLGVARAWSAAGAGAQDLRGSGRRPSWGLDATCGPCRTAARRSEDRVQRAAHAPASAVQDVRVDHGSTDVGVPQELLDRSDIRAAFEKGGGERMPHRVARHALGNPGGEGGLADGPLQHRLVQVVTALCPVSATR